MTCASRLTTLLAAAMHIALHTDAHRRYYTHAHPHPRKRVLLSTGVLIAAVHLTAAPSSDPDIRATSAPAMAASEASRPTYHFDSSFLDPSSTQHVYLVVLNYQLPVDTARLWHKGQWQTRAWSQLQCLHHAAHPDVVHILCHGHPLPLTAPY